MPKLKQIELQGFKSFADPATFMFPTGITAVVGPNGSGKSNVTDAIRWVLGEQRLTAIRGRTGEDMIFAGSGKRSRSGMARAAIVFDNSSGWLPVEFAEVIVERRAYRDGTSDYMLNGSRVRLMDLRDLLDRAGLGRDAYLVIGQGLVDQILSLRPQERLALFEQAAGITPYRTRREDAVTRLDETKRNLQRVYDIVGEVEPRLRRLQRQAARVEEHARLQHELSETLLIWYGYRWGRGLYELEQARQRLAYHEDRALVLLEEADDLGQQVLNQRHQINERRERLAELHRESSVRHTEAGNRQRELAVARERQRQLRERLEETEANLAPLRSALGTEDLDLESLEAELGLRGRELESARARLTEVGEEHARLAQQRHAVLRRQAEAQARALELRHQLGDREVRLSQAEERLADLAAQHDELTKAVTEGTERRRALQAAVEVERRSVEEARAALQQAQQDEVNADRELADSRADADRVQQWLGQQRAEMQRVTVRLEALDRLHADGAGMYAGVRAVMQATEAGDLHGLPGSIASLVRVPAELERAIEAALGSQVQDVVAQTWDDAQRAIDFLKRKRAGRATFLPLDTLRPPSPLDLPRRDGILGVASDLVEYDAVYQSAVLLLLGRTAVAESLEAARRLLRDLRGSFNIVALAGEIVRSSGSVTGGEGRETQGPGLLSRERERRELREQAQDLAQAVAKDEALLAAAESKVRELTEAREACLGRRRLADGLVRERDRALDQAVRQLERAIQDTQWQQAQLEKLAEERDRVQAQVQRLTETRSQAKSDLTAIDSLLSELAVELSSIGEDDVSSRLAEKRTEVAVLEQELESRRVYVESRQREVHRLRRQISEQEQRLEALAAESAQLSTTLDTLATSYDQARREAEELASQIVPLESQLAELEVSLEAQAEREQGLRRVVREAEQRLAQAEVDASRREDQLQALKREIEETLGIVISNLPDTIATQQPLPLGDIVCPLPTVTELPQGLENQVRDLRTQLRRLEPVNPAAKEEYDELAERHKFLREQMEDLEKASAHLREIINELDEMMDTMFSTTFKSIAAEFMRVFELLFNGGNARLELAEGDDGRPGVEILARPPGKRAASLAMLSGGERSLTAVALVFAVMSISPTPFCVLDEVDAMLDEANVGRFRRMLRDLARETQFIIITHNRGTVEVADTIYGVSMGDDGVSSVLSLNLKDLPVSEVI